MTWAFVAVQGLSLAVASWGYSSLLHRLLIMVASPAEHRLEVLGLRELQPRGSEAVARRLEAQAQKLCHTGFSCLWHLGSS